MLRLRLPHPRSLLLAAPLLLAWQCTPVPQKDARPEGNESEELTIPEPVTLETPEGEAEIPAAPAEQARPGKKEAAGPQDKPKPPTPRSEPDAVQAVAKSGERMGLTAPGPASPASGLTKPAAAPETYAQKRGARSRRSGGSMDMLLSGQWPAPVPAAPPEFNTESYAPVSENGFRLAASDPLSTFSIDVDNASYANIRRFLTQGQLPPEDAVRIEECVNYFRYAYPDPEGGHPFSISADIGSTPWNPKTKLVLIGLQGKRLDVRKLPPSNLTFLIDVSGSMAQPNKLPLLQKSFRLLVSQLRPQDRVSIVVYAGAAGLVLPPTPGSNKAAIYAALDNLQAGGSTAGGEGLRLAYETARRNFLPGGNNRVILATDGDFNVGESSDGAMLRLIEEKRKSGVFLSVLGFGMGNYKDSKMEVLAGKGNGNYAYIDNLLEARKVLVEQMGGTLHVLAKDVKLQVEFNPARVQAYRLIGYENRLLNAEDFNDDTKDAGELGAGHSVTALYEIVPAGADLPLPSVDPLKYGRPQGGAAEEIAPDSDGHREKEGWFGGRKPAKDISGELLTVKFRYKRPQEDKSRLLTRVLRDSHRSLEQATENLRFAAAVAGFGMLLRNSEHKGGLTFEQVASLAEGARTHDPEGYRAEFLRLVKLAGTLSAGQAHRGEN